MRQDGVVDAKLAAFAVLSYSSDVLLSSHRNTSRSMSQKLATGKSRQGRLGEKEECRHRCWDGVDSDGNISSANCLCEAAGAADC